MAPKSKDPDIQEDPDVSTLQNSTDKLSKDGVPSNLAAGASPDVVLRSPSKTKSRNASSLKSTGKVSKSSSINNSSRLAVFSKLAA